MSIENEAAKAFGRLGGKVTSEAKTKAVKENGKKGGRPPKGSIKNICICGRKHYLVQTDPKVFVWEGECPDCHKKHKTP